MRGFWVPLAVACMLICSRTTAEQLECGERKVKTVYLVQHGSETKEGHWPWHTAIYHREGSEFVYVCGGSIVDRNTILTAAHCMFTSRGLIKVHQLSVQVGRNQLSEASLHSQEHFAERIILHDGYESNNVANDIALIKLATDITMTRYIQPVCLWNMDSNPELVVGKNGTVVGFGLTEHDRVSDYLRQATIAVIDSWTCIESDREVYGATLTSGMLCGGGRKGVSACNGDSGGGMFFELSDRWYIRGIVSFMPLRENVGLCDGTKYTVFTDVAKYRDWVVQYVDETLAAARADPILVNNNAKLRLLNFNTCGISPYSDEADDDFFAYPWIGLVMMKANEQAQPQGFCQVTLINEWYVLGPAHCFVNDGRERTIRFGDFDKSTETDCIERNGTMICAPPVQDLPIGRIIVHPNYKFITDDVALVELGQPVNMSVPNVRPICLPVTVDLRSHNPETFFLGSFPTDGDRIERSQPAYLNSVNCQERYNAIGVYLRKSYSEICAIRLPTNHTGPCDKMVSGGALQTKQMLGGRTRFFLSGLLSYGPRECEPTVPEVYTNVGTYLDWILYNMRMIRKDAPEPREKLIFVN